jgi:hypothetical protein
VCKATESVAWLPVRRGTRWGTIEPMSASPISTKPLSWAEIRTRVDTFVAEWSKETSEKGEAQSFWTDFLDCFGVSRRRVATFERNARRASTGGGGFIDMFWPNVVIAEAKSRGVLTREPEKAEKQALDYLNGGDVSAKEWPRYILTADFATMRLTDLEAPKDDATVTFPLADLPKHVERFAFIAGYQQRRFSTDEEAAASIEASNLMADLYVALTGDDDTGFTETPEEEDERARNSSVLMTRLLFLMFGDDAGLWERNLFAEFVADRTAKDGSDLGSQLTALFDVLNTPEGRRSSRTDELMARFPYVNGALFADRTLVPFFDASMRESLLDACRFEWTKISAAVFGSLFQAIKSKALRRAGGEHYTTEDNILKTIEPLFLDELRAKVKGAWQNPKRLRQVHNSFADMRYLDPACGCGNFLVVAYREMRRLELDILLRLRELEKGHATDVLDVTWGLKVSLDQFHGIEINWWPAKIAETAMFLVDHQANREMALALGQAPDRLPIKITAHIHHLNALTSDWLELLPPNKSTLVFGNPPFLGHVTRTEKQADELRAVWRTNNPGRLDYVTGWYRKTLDYFVGAPGGRFAFVSTNSITQGDQAARLFGPVFSAGWRILFAHRTFAWTSEATGRAAVHCVIVGFTREDAARARLFDYVDLRGGPTEVSAVTSINAYLVDGPNVLSPARTTVLSPSLPQVVYGSLPADDGNLIVEADEYNEVMADPVASQYVRPYRGARELVNDLDRWCLWLVDLDPDDVTRSAILSKRLEAVRAFRKKSPLESTRKMADLPHLFYFNGQPKAQYLCIPSAVSETRRYYTTKLLDPGVISSNATSTAIDPDGFAFAIISSSMFMAWQRTVGGRLKSDLRFSKKLSWNTLPLPEVDFNTRSKIIKAGNAVLDARMAQPDRSLAQMYNPFAMKPGLVHAHNALDAVVDRAFGAKKTCSTERERQAVLFARYEEMTREGHLR